VGKTPWKPSQNQNGQETTALVIEGLEANQGENFRKGKLLNGTYGNSNEKIGEKHQNQGRGKQPYIWKKKTPEGSVQRWGGVPKKKGHVERRTMTHTG